MLSKARYGYRMGNDALIDAMILEGLWCAFENHHMGMWAENIATEFEVTRRDQDELAAKSHQRAARAWERGVFTEEVVPVEVPQRKGPPVVVEKDEHIRPDTTVEKLAGLRPAFRPDGTVTAGNASGINDGAAAVVVMSRAGPRRWARSRWPPSVPTPRRESSRASRAWARCPPSARRWPRPAWR